jgi:hypothetical protein
MDRISLDSDTYENDAGYDGEWSQRDIDWQREVDYHTAHCGRCIRDEHCETLKRIWNS